MYVLQKKEKYMNVHKISWCYSDVQYVNCGCLFSGVVGDMKPSTSLLFLLTSLQYIYDLSWCCYC